MRKLLLVGVLLAVVSGCDKINLRAKRSQTAQQAAQTPATNNSGGPSVHAPSGVVINPGGGGGSGGAVQAVRGAVNRVVTQAEMHDLQIYINTYETSSGRMPSVAEIMEALKQSPKTLKAVQEKGIVLTGTRRRENIWAYSGPQQGGIHWVLTATGIDRVNRATLEQRLDQQGTQ